MPPCCASHLHRPLSSPIPITNRKTKRQSLCCMMRPVFGGPTGIVFTSEKSAGYKNSPVVFAHTVHLPIKMQMSARLRLRLSKQNDEMREKRLRGINERIKSPNPVATTQQEGNSLCGAAFVTHKQLNQKKKKKKTQAFGSVWRMMGTRRAEGDCCSPQRRMTHICYWQRGTQRHTDAGPRLSLFLGSVSSESLQGIAD